MDVQTRPRRKHLMDVGKFSGHRLYIGLRLDYRLWLWAPTSALLSLFTLAEFLVSISTESPSMF